MTNILEECSQTLKRETRILWVTKLILLLGESTRRKGNIFIYYFNDDHRDREKNRQNSNLMNPSQNFDFYSIDDIKGVNNSS